MEEKSVAVKRTDKGVKVVFKGTWTRNDVEGVYRAMIMELPRHLAEVRKADAPRVQAIKEAEAKIEEDKIKAKGEEND